VSPQKYFQTFDQLRPLLKKSYRGRSTRIDFTRPRTKDRDRLFLAKRPFHDSRPDQLAIDDAVQRAGLKPLGHAWQSLSRPVALQHLTFALSTNLVYGIEILPAALATSIATAFLAVLPDARCFTNGLFPGPKPKPYSTIYSQLLPVPITSSLLDTGLILIDDLHILALWVEGND